jgi:hypothetical protein
MVMTVSSTEDLSDVFEGRRLRDSWGCCRPLADQFESALMV